MNTIQKYISLLVVMAVMENYLEHHVAEPMVVEMVGQHMLVVQAVIQHLL